MVKRMSNRQGPILFVMWKPFCPTCDWLTVLTCGLIRLDCLHDAHLSYSGQASIPLYSKIFTDTLAFCSCPCLVCAHCFLCFLLPKILCEWHLVWLTYSLDSDSGLTDCLFWILTSDHALFFCCLFVFIVLLKKLLFSFYLYFLCYFLASEFSNTNYTTQLEKAMTEHLTIIIRP